MFQPTLLDPQTAPSSVDPGLRTPLGSTFSNSDAPEDGNSLVRVGSGDRIKKQDDEGKDCSRKQNQQCNLTP